MGGRFLLCELRKKKETGCMRASEEKKSGDVWKRRSRAREGILLLRRLSFYFSSPSVGRLWVVFFFFFCRCLKKTREEKKKKNKKIPFLRHRRYHHQLWHLKIVFPSLSLFFFLSLLVWRRSFFFLSLLLGVIADRIAAVSTTATFFFITRWMRACVVLWSGL